MVNILNNRIKSDEIFINMYIQEVRQLVKCGIKSAYVDHDGSVYYDGQWVDDNICSVRPAMWINIGD